MRNHPSFQARLGRGSADEVFDYLTETLQGLRPTLPSYYVNWQKARSNAKRIEMALHLLDYILDKPDKARALFEVIEANPFVAEALPSVFASRASRHLLMSKAYGPAEFEFLTESIQSAYDTQRIVDFCDEIGLLRFIEQASISSFKDYVLGVEVGMDTNGRKNRGGKQMEESVEEYVSAICEAHGFNYITQATALSIQANFGKRLTVDRTDRAFDFAVNTPTALYVIETNYYDGGGSKLKSTAGEYKTVFNLVKSCGHQFIWITDGKGWTSTIRALRETFDSTDYILNLNMVACGVLEDLLAS